MRSKHVLIVARIVLLFLGLGMFASSCSRWQIKKELNRFFSMEIQFPTDMLTVQNGVFGDSMAVALPHQIKLVVYSGPESCSSCKLGHLFEMDQLFDLHVDRKLFSPVIIFAPEEQAYPEVVKILRSQPHAYPIYIDKNNVFRQLNSQLPSNPRYHTFLLDRNNHVVVIGDPLVSNNMWQLFKSTLDNMLAHDGEYVPEK